MGTPTPSQDALEPLREDLTEREETVIRLHLTNAHEHPRYQTHALTAHAHTSAANSPVLSPGGSHTKFAWCSGNRSQLPQSSSHALTLSNQVAHTLHDRILMLDGGDSRRLSQRRHGERGCRHAQVLRNLRVRNRGSPRADLPGPAPWKVRRIMTFS